MEEIMSTSPLLVAKDLSLHIAGRRLFSNLSFSIAPGEVLALAGANGCGKSTLLKLIAGQSLSTEDFSLDGDLRCSSEAAPVLLPQLVTSGECRPYSAATNNHRQLGRAKRLLVDLGFPPDSEMPSERLSDGQRQKLALAEVLTSDANLLLLDEPTNYLDIDGLLTFESYLARLKRHGSGMILVTHDRALSDMLADHTILITTHDIYSTPGGYSAAWSVRCADMQSRKERSASIRRQIAKLEDDSRRRMNWSAQKERTKTGAKLGKGFISHRAAKQAKRSKAIQQRAEREKERLQQTKPFVPKQITLSAPEYRVANRDVFSLHEISFAYPTQEQPCLVNATLTATTRDKLCLMGANGSGKTTLLRLITGELQPVSGECRCHPDIKLTYLQQGLQDFFEPGTLLDNFADCHADETTVRIWLGQALLRKDKPQQPIDTLSYGELMRAAVVKCLLMRSEFLLLDEPTSHLDVESIEVIEQILSDFPGGFLIVSHDRRFVQEVGQRLYVLNNSSLTLA
ncbi:ATP-binding cassette domain-containing protein [candidate division GN15 bacterium]|nr:ATP-binding cassette domain-containing protein [candidate division GN15 bacterium]